MRIKDCPECMAYLDSQPHLIASCASVGISHNKSTSEMVVIFLSGYHNRGHRESDHGLDSEASG